MTPRHADELRTLAVIMAISAALGGGYGQLVNPAPGGGFGFGAVVGATIGGSLTAIELFYSRRPRGQWLARLPFSVFVLAKTLVFSLVIVAEMHLLGLLFGGEGSLAEPAGLVRDLAFSLAVSFGVILFLEIDRLLGGGVLLRLLLGRYHRPRIEQRVFLFADVIGSTALAERLGDLRFHGFLNRVFFDLVDPITDHGGAIYRYVGDEVIVTWPLDEGLDQACCLACARAMQATLAQRAPGYERTFGAVPAIRIALHAGPVVTGEMGDLKREIVFLGDTVNTAARLEALAKTEDRDLVASAAVLDGLALPSGLESVSLGAAELKGKAQRVPVFALQSTQGPAR